MCNKRRLYSPHMTGDVSYCKQFNRGMSDMLYLFNFYSFLRNQSNGLLQWKSPLFPETLFPVALHWNVFCRSRLAQVSPFLNILDFRSVHNKTRTQIHSYTHIQFYTISDMTSPRLALFLYQGNYIIFFPLL